MSLQDPIADMLTRVRNGYLASKKEVEIPYGKIKEKIAKIQQSLDNLKKISKKQEFHLKIDTGMGRLGINEKEVDEAIKIIKHKSSSNKYQK